MAVDVRGHPAIEIEIGGGRTTLLTVCASCGQLRTILFLSRDRWFCTRCRAEGATAPSIYPIGGRSG